MPPAPVLRRAALAALAVSVAASVVACGSDTAGTDAAPGAAAGGDPGDTLVIYSGRNEELVGELVGRLQDAVGIPVEVRYGSTAALAAQLVEEGPASPADLFFGQDAGALGVLADRDMLVPLPDDVLDVVDEPYRATDATWVATSARARVLAHNTSVPADELPDEVDELLDERFRGQVAYAPTNASWYSFVTALRVERGEDGAREWLEGFAANDPVAFEGNGAIVDAVAAGDVPFGLVNHYYRYAKGLEEGFDGLTVANHSFAADDEGSLVNVAGAGVLAAGDNPAAATDAVRFLLSEPAQQYFADTTAEYPVRDGVSSSLGLPPLDEVDGLDIDLAQLASLEQTQELLADVGLGS